MEPRDINYLKLQFWHQVYQRDGTNYQTFCEGILQAAFPDFKKVRPYGNVGDRGNDGYRESIGAYYQMYAPQEPQTRGADAAKKLAEDFGTLKNHWDDIAQVKEYYFVFNDKGRGTTVPLENALAKLRVENPGITFAVLVPHDLEHMFLRLKPDDILSLGFDIDLTKAISLAYRYLDHVKLLLDRGNGDYAEKALSGLAAIVSSLQDDRLTIEYELAHCLMLQRLEKTTDAQKRYERLCALYPNDLRPLLSVAEIHLDLEHIDANQELLDRATAIDGGHWLVQLHKLLRKLRLEQHSAVSDIDENTFPKDPRHYSTFLRLYAVQLAQTGDLQRAASFIERAIELNPNRSLNYIVRIEILEMQILKEAEDDSNTLRDGMSRLLAEIDSVEQTFKSWGDVSPRTQAILNSFRITIFHRLDNLYELERIAGPTAHLLLRCYFDHQIDHLFVPLLQLAGWPSVDLASLLAYLRRTDTKRPSDELCKALAFQFLLKGTLLTEGKQLFQDMGQVALVRIISTLEQEQYDETWHLLKTDLPFAVAIACAAKEMPQLRRKIVASLPSDGTIRKDKLLLLLNYDEENIDEAFRILQGMDLSRMSYAESEIVLKVVEAREAWDFAAVILDKLLEHEYDKQRALQWKVKHIQALFRLERFPDVVAKSEALLANNVEMELLSPTNREWVLGQALLALMKRGDQTAAKDVLERHANFVHSNEFRFGIEAEIYLANELPREAIAALISGLREFGSPSPEQYANLFYLTVRIGNLLDLTPTADDAVSPGSFVKIKGQERWYFIGEGDELDATKVAPTDPKYDQFIGKRVSETVAITTRYSSQNTDYVIETILPVEQYVCWQSAHHAQQLTREQRWDKMEMIEVPKTGNSIDPKYLIARMEDEQRKTQDIFDLFCQGKVPLAFLAITQGGLAGAIGIICNEERGYILSCPDHLPTVNRQKEVANRLIAGEAFYLDGTSALVLSETGLLAKIYAHLPGLKVPQSVISFLLETRERFTPSPGQVGFMRYTKGKLHMSQTNEERAAAIRKNFQESVTILESDPNKAKAISAANKADCVSEQRVPAYLCDACVLAQREGTHLLTEDSLYLQANEIETGKKPPLSCSTAVLARILYELGKISFDEYLEYFAYLSSYRFKFLPLSSDDLENAVFGTGPIKRLQPERLRLFNFRLTLSEDYGVPSETSMRVLAMFLTRILIDDTVLPDVAAKIVREILMSYPTTRDRRMLGRSLLGSCVEVINILRSRRPVGLGVQPKVDAVARYIELFGPGIVELP